MACMDGSGMTCRSYVVCRSCYIGSLAVLATVMSFDHFGGSSLENGLVR